MNERENKAFIGTLLLCASDRQALASFAADSGKTVLIRVLPVTVLGILYTALNFSGHSALSSRPEPDQMISAESAYTMAHSYMGFHAGVFLILASIIMGILEYSQRRNSRAVRALLSLMAETKSPTQ